MFPGRNGTSIVDYAICEQDLFLSVAAHFVVKEPSCFSGHSSVITWLKIETNEYLADKYSGNFVCSLPALSVLFFIIEECIDGVSLVLQRYV